MSVDIETIAVISGIGLTLLTPVYYLFWQHNILLNRLDNTLDSLQARILSCKYCREATKEMRFGDAT